MTPTTTSFILDWISPHSVAGVRVTVGGWTVVDISSGSLSRNLEISCFSTSNCSSNRWSISSVVIVLRPVSVIRDGISGSHPDRVDALTDISCSQWIAHDSNLQFLYT